MRSHIMTGLGALYAVVAAGAASAAEVVDQSQLIINDERPLAINAGYEQKLAQSFRAGVTADLVAVEFPIACSSEGSGSLYVEIQTLNADGEPSGSVLRRATLNDPGAALPAPHSFRRIYLPRPVRQTAGQRYAIVVRADGDTSCSILDGPPGDSYVGGESFFDARPNPPGWIGGKDRPGDDETAWDLPFKTIINDGTGNDPNDCMVAGFGPSPVPPSYTPLCRCLEDPGHREFRCGIMHPDFFLIRRIPFPVPIGKAYTERWEFAPSAPVSYPVRIELKSAAFPKGEVLEFKSSKAGAFQSRVVKMPAIKDIKQLQSGAVVTYGQETFGIDTTIGEELLEGNAGANDLKQAPMKKGG